MVDWIAWLPMARSFECQARCMPSARQQRIRAYGRSFATCGPAVRRPVPRYAGTRHEHDATLTRSSEPFQQEHRLAPHRRLGIPEEHFSLTPHPLRVAGALRAANACYGADGAGAACGGAAAAGGGRRGPGRHVFQVGNQLPGRGRTARTSDHHHQRQWPGLALPVTFILLTFKLIPLLLPR